LSSNVAVNSVFACTVSSHGVRQLWPDDVLTSAPGGADSNRKASVVSERLKKFRFGMTEHAATDKPHATTAMTRLILDPTTRATLRSPYPTLRSHEAGSRIQTSSRDMAHDIENVNVAVVRLSCTKSISRRTVRPCSSMLASSGSKALSRSARTRATFRDGRYTGSNRRTRMRRQRSGRPKKIGADRAKSRQSLQRPLSEVVPT
jgi:hypothetical protein